MDNNFPAKPQLVRAIYIFSVFLFADCGRAAVPTSGISTVTEGGITTPVIMTSTGLKRLQWHTPSADEAKRRRSVSPAHFSLDDASGSPHFTASPHSARPAMPPVKDQGNRGTCNTFAAVALFEVGRNVNFSEQCLAYFSAPEDAANVGTRITYGVEHGVYLQSDCPYDGSANGRGNIPDLSKAQVQPMPMNMASDSYQPDSSDLVIMMLQQGVPVAASVYVRGPQWNDGRAPITITDGDMAITTEQPGCIESQENKETKPCPAHAIVLTDYDEKSKVFEFRNSWGSGWGDEGYGYMSFDYFDLAAYWLDYDGADGPG